MMFILLLSYRDTQTNPADSYPMAMHGQFMLMGNVDTMLKYLENTFNSAKDYFPANQVDIENYEKIMKWHNNIFKPRCELLIKLMLDVRSTDDEKRKNV